MNKNKSDKMNKPSITPGAIWKVVPKINSSTGEEVIHTFDVSEWLKLERIGDKYYKASIGNYNFDVLFEEHFDSEGHPQGKGQPLVKLKQSSVGERLARETGASYLERRAEELLANGTPEDFLFARQYKEEAKALRMGAERP